MARDHQGAGRHDAPSHYGAWYCARDAVSAIAEAMQYLRGNAVHDADFQRADGLTKAIVRLRFDGSLRLVNLDDASELVRRRLRPSQVATTRRATTQPIAVAVFGEGAGGLEWWSSLDAEWINVTLFHERVLPHTTLDAPPRSLSVRLPEVQEAADRLGIELAA